MNFQHAGTIFRKEIKDIMRDRRTLLTTLLLPLVLMPVLFFFMGSSMSSMEKSIEENTRIGITARADSPQVRALLLDMLAGIQNVELVPDDDLTALEREDVPVVLDVPDDADAIVAAGGSLPVEIIYDESKLASSGTANRIASTISSNADEALSAKLRALGYELSEMTPARPFTTDIARLRGEEASGGNMFISMVLPMMLALMLWSGSIAASTDVVAGEKERYTLEPLLATRASRTSILLGKFFAVMVFMGMSLISTLVGNLLAFTLAPQITGAMGGSMNFRLPAGYTLLTILNIVMLGATFISVQIALSAAARSLKQAQQWLSMLMLLVLIPAYATMFMQAGDVSLPMMLVPVLNTIASMKMLLGGVLRADMMIVSLVSTLLYMIAAMALTVRMFGKESVLFRT